MQLDGWAQGATTNGHASQSSMPDFIIFRSRPAKEMIYSRSALPNPKLPLGIHPSWLGEPWLDRSYPSSYKKESSPFSFHFHYFTVEWGPTAGNFQWAPNGCHRSFLPIFCPIWPPWDRIPRSIILSCSVKSFFLGLLCCRSALSSTLFLFSLLFLGAHLSKMSWPSSSTKIWSTNPNPLDN